MDNTRKILSIIKFIPSAIIALIFVCASFIALFVAPYFLLIAVIFIVNLLAAAADLKAALNNTVVATKSIVVSLVISGITTLFFLVASVGSGEGVFILFALMQFVIAAISVYELIDNNKGLPTSPTTSSPAVSPDLNKLIEYKELLDLGAITQEEYEEKKKQILNR